MTTVLVVDDEPDIRVLVRMTLARAGYDVVEAETGEAAVALLTARTDIDVVLLDVRLPGISGWDVLEQVGALASEASPQFVMLSAHVDAVARERAKAVGAAVYLSKPFLPDELIAAVAGLSPG